MSYYTVIQLFVITLMLVCSGAEVEGKRGCRSFGHSCYGGIGKRNPGLLNASNNFEKPEYILPSAWGPFRSNQLQIRNPPKMGQLSAIIAQWISNFKEAQNMPRTSTA
ncbi:neuropeptide CCHamide-2-like isoform X2 [Leptinotarsa decemlineata]|uniref:neuropeptide CCHamide-2-like isoform X2 n=1 Tax=Leptinotarsa decemlineata TaxID=7539 RepID=UPI003D306935